MNKNYILPVFIMISGVLVGLSFGYHSVLEKNDSSDSDKVIATVESTTLILYADDFEIPTDSEQQIMTDLSIIIKLMENRTK